MISCTHVALQIIFGKSITYYEKVLFSCKKIIQSLFYRLYNGAVYKSCNYKDITELGIDIMASSPTKPTPSVLLDDYHSFTLTSVASQIKGPPLARNKSYIRLYNIWKNHHNSEQDGKRVQGNPYTKKKRRKRKTRSLKDLYESTTEVIALH